MAIIVITADRGLAGGYNPSSSGPPSAACATIAPPAATSSWSSLGRKGDSYFRYRNQPILASVTGVSDRPTYEDARRVVAAVMEPFEAGELDQIDLVYTRFISLGSQAVTERQLIPMPVATTSGRAVQPDPAPGESGGRRDARHVSGHKTDYEFEPEPAEILDRLLPRWLESEVLAAMLEAAASEHAARQRAMKAATDNADELIKTLRRVMNRARQDSITTEIMEIVGGSEALRQAGLADGSGPRHEIFVPAAESA